MKCFSICFIFSTVIKSNPTSFSVAIWTSIKVCCRTAKFVECITYPHNTLCFSKKLFHLTVILCEFTGRLSCPGHIIHRKTLLPWPHYSHEDFPVLATLFTAKLSCPDHIIHSKTFLSWPHYSQENVPVLATLFTGKLSCPGHIIPEFCCYCYNYTDSFFYVHSSHTTKSVPHFIPTPIALIGYETVTSEDYSTLHQSTVTIFVRW
jgi:hypothetical protein